MVSQTEKKRDLSVLIEYEHASFLKHRPSLLVLAITILVAVLAFLKMRELENIRLQNEFEHISKNAVAFLKDAVDNNIEVLDQLSSFYAASSTIERDEFRQFSDYILKRHGDILMIGWAPRMSPLEIETYRLNAARDGIEDFSIKEYDHRGLTVPAETRDEYYPLYFAEPLRTNESVLGLDQASYSVTRNALRKAIVNELPASTAVMALPQFENEPPASRYGFHVFAPIYGKSTQALLESKSPFQAIEQSEKPLLGFAVAAFHVRRMVETVMRKIDTPEMEMRIYAEGVRDKNKLIYTYNPQTSEKLKKSWKTSTELNIAGQTWTVVCASTEVFSKNRRRWEGPAVFLVGMFLGFLLALYIFSFERKRIRDILIALSLTDELTDLYNRRGLWLLADEQVRISTRYKRGFWLLAMDLDHLKKINDTLGHPEGDRAIKRTAQLLRETFRNSDIVARVGGDEFVVLALETNPASLPVLLERLQTQLQKNNKQNDSGYLLEISTGAAFFDPEKPVTLDELIAQADKALYSQKKEHQSRSAGR